MASAPSPFLPSTNVQYAWDSTSLGYLKTCGRLYFYIMIEGWTPKDESVHLRFGQEFHSALEQFDRLRTTGVGFEEALHIVIAELMIRTHSWEVDETTKAGKYKNKFNLRQLVIDYLDKYKNDNAKTFILQDGRPAVELSFRFELDWGPEASRSTYLMDNWNEIEKQVNEGKEVEVPTGPQQPYVLSGHLDRVVDFNDELFVMDRKTATMTLSSYYFDQFEPNNQMTLYSLASKIVLEAPVKGVIIDAAQILLEKPNHFQRGITYRSEDQLTEWVQDLRFWLTISETYAAANYWPHNDTACDKYGGCRFRQVCSKSPSVRETWLKANFIKLAPEDRWNPLKPR